MKYGSLILEKKEYVLLKRIMNVSWHADDPLVRSSIKKLNEELLTATICNEEEMPVDVVRFNSIFTVSSSKWEKKIQLVAPSKSDLKMNKISIMAPMGAAVIGYSTGDSIKWEFPKGIETLNILDVEQVDDFIDVNILV